MAETNYTAVDFSTLSATDDGNTILYKDGQLCQSTTSLGKVVDSKILAKGYATETAVNNTINALSGTITAGYATKEDVNSALKLKQDVFTAGASNNDLLTYTQNDGLSWSSPTAILDDNINHDVLDINNDGVLDFNYDFIDGSGGLTLSEINGTLIVNLSNDGAINRRSAGELYVGTDNTLTVNEKVGYNDTYLSVTNPVPDPGSNQHRGHVLTVNNSDGIVWQAPTALIDLTPYLTKTSADTLYQSVGGMTGYVSKTDYDNLYNAFTGLTAWLSPISANIVTASNN